MEKTQLDTKENLVFPYDAPYLKQYCPDDFSEEEIMIEKTVEGFVADQVIPQLEAMEANDYDVIKKLFNEAGELGLLGADVPEVYGGLEMGKKTSGLIAEKMGYGSSFGVSFNIHTGVGTFPYVYFGTKEQKEKYIPKLASGEWIGAYALTEPNAGSDALAASASAKLSSDGNSYILNGEKQWITNAHVANVYVVFAKTEEGMTAFIVERDTAGVSVGPEEQKLGIKGSSTATLILEDVHVPKENILGELGKGHYIALNILNLARLKLAFSNIGSAKQALETAVTYGKERKQFKQELVNFTMIQEKLADMAIKIFRSESSVYYTARLIDHEDIDETNVMKVLSKYAIDCALNKVDASETLDFVVDEALQIHGGYGYMEEYDIERMYRDARINRIFEGTNEINRITISRSFLKQYGKDASIIAAGASDTKNERNNAYFQAAVSLLQLVMKSLSDEGKLQLEQDQEFLRLIADMIKDTYTMKASMLRSDKAEENETHYLVSEVVCEENYRAVENATVVIISSIVSDEAQKEKLLQDIKNNSAPLYSNIIEKKRQIAKEVIANNGYYV